jgi:hypothetical protein
MDANEHTTSPAAAVETILAELAPELARAGQAAKSRNLPGVGTIYLRGNVWWIKYSFRGRRVRESSKSTRERDAIKLLRKRIEEVGKGRRRDPVSENKVRMSAFFATLEADYRNNGRRSTATLGFRLAPLREAFGQDRALDVTAGRIARYRDDRLSAVRNLVDAGVDQRVAMAITTGHQTIRVFQRYRIVSDDDVRAALERVQAPSAPAKGTESPAE